MTTPARPRPWVVIVVSLWGAVLVGAILWAVTHAGPTAREQTLARDALPVVDAAVTTVAAAATADGLAVVAVSDLHRSQCRVTVVYDGARYQRSVVATVTPGTEAALLDRVAARLPTDYRPSVRRGEVPRLTADAGNFVSLTGTVTTPGQVRFLADTGNCRPDEGTAAVATLGSAPVAPADRIVAQAALDRLGLVAQQWARHQASCPGGGLLTSVEAIGPDGVVPIPLDTALAGGGGVALGDPVVSTPTLYAYRVGSVGVAVREDSDHIVVTATTPCP